MNGTYRLRLLFTVAVLLAFAGALFAGGWAIVTLNEFPDYAVAGKPLKLTFAVRQHGVTLLSDLKPSVNATNAKGLTAKAAANPSTSRGEYTATLKFPEPGDWTITVVSGFNDNTSTLPALKVIADEGATPIAFSPGTRGARLFATKGCVGCHRHVEVNPQRTGDAKFDLTGRRFQPDYLKKFLADPGVKTPDMPNLKLKDDEIESLAAFINKAVMKQAREGDSRGK
jgi:mono/diheme cytochrome c family protein